MSTLHLVKEPDPQDDRARLFAKAEEISLDLARRGAALDAEGKPPLAEIDRLRRHENLHLRARCDHDDLRTAHNTQTSIAGSIAPTTRTTASPIIISMLPAAV